nr:ABC transporter A family member 9-like [Tanacetum cinerariifolium]
MDKCAAIGYEFLSFSFSSLGELEADVVTLLKRIRKFFMTQDIETPVVVYIFNMIGFAIAKRVGAQIFSRLSSNFFVDFNFTGELVTNRVAKTIVLMATIYKINDLSVFEMAQCSFDAALRFALERIVTASDLVLLIGNRDFPRYPFHSGCLLSIVQTMNGKTYRCVLCYRLGVPIFSVSKLCSACSKVFTGDIYGYHAVSCAGIIGIKHRHNVMHDTLVDICFRSEILAGKEVDIGSSPLTQTGMVDFVPGHAMIDATHHKRVKYEAKCAKIGYGFLPFSFSSVGELEKDDVTLLKWI